MPGYLFFNFLFFVLGIEHRAFMMSYISSTILLFILRQVFTFWLNCPNWVQSCDSLASPSRVLGLQAYPYAQFVFLSFFETRYLFFFLFITWTCNICCWEGFVCVSSMVESPLFQYILKSSGMFNLFTIVTGIRYLFISSKTSSTGKKEKQTNKKTKTTKP